MRWEDSAIGESTYSSTLQSAHFLIAASIAFALKTAISYCESVKITTPALPPDSAIAWKAAVSETSCGTS